MDGASAALELAQGIGELDLQRWRKAGYAAIDRMIEFLSKKVTDGEDFERASSVLEQESKNVKAAAFGEMLNTLGIDELTRKSCPCPDCGKILRSPRNLRRSNDTLCDRIAVQRPYFYCRPCHRGTIPFDDKLGLSPSYKQYDLQKKAARLFADVPYRFRSTVGVTQTHGYFLTHNAILSHSDLFMVFLKYPFNSLTLNFCLWRRVNGFSFAFS